jgi:secreted PhoX family phosphatase
MRNLVPFGYSDGDVDTNRSANVSLEELVGARLSRRQTLSGLGASMAAFMGTSLLAACGEDDAAPLLPTSVSLPGQPASRRRARSST